MKPKTKNQKGIVLLSGKLPVITEEQKMWALRKCFQFVGRKTKKNITCLSCGHEFVDKNNEKKSICPICAEKLVIQKSLKRVFEYGSYFCILTKSDDYQVIRIFFAELKCRVGYKADFYCNEVVQHWIQPNGKFETLARLRHQSVIYYDLWDFRSHLEIRRYQDIYDINPYYFAPNRKYLPQIKRNGFKGRFHEISPLKFFTGILSSSMAETLLKSNQIELFKLIFKSYERKIRLYWASIKICIRNRCVIDDPTLWLDYLDMLSYFNKDIHNPKYVCLSGHTLKEQHNLLRERKEKIMQLEREQQDRINKENRIKNMQHFESVYKKKYKRYFDLLITNGLITIQPLKSVLEFKEEGDALNHCVFTNDYYQKDDSLILSATVDGVRTETIQLHLKTMQIIQCRGYDNTNSVYHQDILNLLKTNIHQISKRMTA